MTVEEVVASLHLLEPGITTVLSPNGRMLVIYAPPSSLYATIKVRNGMVKPAVFKYALRRTIRKIERSLE